MPGKNKTPLLGWHPPAELSAWIRAEAGRRGCPVSALLNEAVDNLRSYLEADPRIPADAAPPWFDTVSFDDDGHVKSFTPRGPRKGDR